MARRSDEETYNLLLGILGTRNKVDRFHVTDVDLVPEDVREDDLAEVLLLLPSVEISLCRRGEHKSNSVSLRRIAAVRMTNL